MIPLSSSRSIQIYQMAAEPNNRRIALPEKIRENGTIENHLDYIYACANMGRKVALLENNYQLRGVTDQQLYS